MANSSAQRASFAERVLSWYDRNGRKHLPWQQQVTPYRVWLSEIMLQQTQVTTVIPYFEAFTRAFPQVSDLAAADTDQVLALWAGLGYYSRARNLHRAAQMIESQFQGKFPPDIEALCQLPGVGRSTAAAIVSLAFNQPATIMDGNVKRVLCRYHAVEGWPGTSAVDKQLWQLAESHQPKNRPAHYTQAMMDLGATVCHRSRPTCTLCPLNADCRARINDLQADYPNRKPSKTLPHKTTVALMAIDPQGAVLLIKRPPSGIWGGLWSLPEISDEQQLQPWLTAQGLRLLRHETWPSFRHTFSHYHLHITPLLIEVDTGTRIADEQSRWQHPDRLDVGLPAPIAKLLVSLKACSKSFG